jgi:hypothetical protein
MIGCTETVALHLLFQKSPVNLAVLTGNRYISSKQDEGELKVKIVPSATVQGQYPTIGLALF